MKDSNVQGLKERLQRKIETDRETIEALTEMALQQLTGNLRNAAKDALSTIETDIHDRCRHLADTLDQHLHELTERTMKGGRIKRRIWTKAAALSLLALALIFGGHLGLMELRRIWMKDQATTEELARVRSEIQLAEAELSSIREKSWGVTFNQNENGRFIILPKGWTGKTGWRLEEREAIKIERRK